jgi:hypothetical protein
MDTSGAELRVITGIRGHSVRMKVETQQNPVEPERQFTPARIR